MSGSEILSFDNVISISIKPQWFAGEESVLATLSDQSGAYTNPNLAWNYCTLNYTTEILSFPNPKLCMYRANNFTTCTMYTWVFFNHDTHPSARYLRTLITVNVTMSYPLGQLLNRTSKHPTFESGKQPELFWFFLIFKKMICSEEGSNCYNKLCSRFWCNIKF